MTTQDPPIIPEESGKLKAARVSRWIVWFVWAYFAFVIVILLFAFFLGHHPGGFLIYILVCLVGQGHDLSHGTSIFTRLVVRGNAVTGCDKFVV